MEKFNQEELRKLHLPSSSSHKGQNGKLMIIGGSHLFHGASLWTLKVASRIVDMVFYSSIPENNELTQKLKSEIYDFIAIPREKIDSYINEADAVLLGPGMPREEGREGNEESTKDITKRLLIKYPTKKWIIDAGALTEMEPEWLKQLNGNVILTPHHREFQMLFKMEATDDNVIKMARDYNCVILLKGETDLICNSIECVRVTDGNAGMTKGGTGDVLSGLVAALSCKNDLFLAAKSASFINKKAGDELFKRVGYYFNASDLADEIPKAMRELLL